MLNLTESNFHEERSKAKYLVVDFWAEWCPPCRAMNPVLAEVAEQFPSVTFAKVNTEERALVEEYSIGSIPSFILFKDGQIVTRWTGASDAKSFAKLLKDKGIE